MIDDREHVARVAVAVTLFVAMCGVIVAIAGYLMGWWT